MSVGPGCATTQRSVTSDVWQCRLSIEGRWVAIWLSLPDLLPLCGFAKSIKLAFQSLSLENNGRIRQQEQERRVNRVTGVTGMTVVTMVTEVTKKGEERRKCQHGRTAKRRRTRRSKATQLMEVGRLI